MALSKVGNLEIEICQLEEDGIEFVQNRKNTKRVLTELAEYLTMHHSNAQGAKVAGSAVGIVGSGLAIAGFIASLFTFGASLALVGVGAGIGAAGGLTTVGSLTAEIITSKITESGAKEVLEGDKEAYERFLLAFERVKGAWDDLNAATEVLGRSIVAVRQGVSVATNAAMIGVQAASVGRAAGQTAFKAASIAGRGLAITGAAFSVVAIPIDLYTLITSAHNIGTRRVPELAVEITKIAQDLCCPTEEEMRENVNALRNEMLPICN